MGSKYGSYESRTSSKKEPTPIHPVWRGVGFVLMVLVPIISYAATMVLLDLNYQKGWFPLPVDMFARPGQFLYRLIPDEMLYIKIVIFLVIAILLFAIVNLFTFIVTGAAGVGPKNDPFYVPPVRHVPRRRRR